MASSPGPASELHHCDHQHPRNSTFTIEQVGPDVEFIDCSPTPRATFSELPWSATMPSGPHK